MQTEVMPATILGVRDLNDHRALGGTLRFISSAQTLLLTVTVRGQGWQIIRASMNSSRKKTRYGGKL